MQNLPRPEEPFDHYANYNKQSERPADPGRRARMARFIASRAGRTWMGIGLATAGLIGGLAPQAIGAIERHDKAAAEAFANNQQTLSGKFAPIMEAINAAAVAKHAQNPTDYPQTTEADGAIRVTDERDGDPQYGSYTIMRTSNGQPDTSASGLLFAYVEDGPGSTVTAFQAPGGEPYAGEAPIVGDLGPGYAALYSSAYAGENAGLNTDNPGQGLHPMLGDTVPTVGQVGDMIAQDWKKQHLSGTPGVEPNLPAF